MEQLSFYRDGCGTRNFVSVNNPSPQREWLTTRYMVITHEVVNKVKFAKKPVLSW